MKEGENNEERVKRKEGRERGRRKEEKKRENSEERVRRREGREEGRRGRRRRPVTLPP